MRILFRSTRLRFTSFVLDDAADVYACITPEITRFMRWEPPASFETFRARRLASLQAENRLDRSFVVRHSGTLECLGVAGIESVAEATPEIGLWLRADAHGRGYGSETAAAVIEWAAEALKCEAFDYPVAVDNVASRRIAERLGGVLIARRTNPKYESVVYRIPASGASRRTAPASD